MTHLKMENRSKQNILNRGTSTGWETLKCLKSLAIREIQIKTSLRFHLTPVRMAKIKNTSDSSCWWRYETRRTLLHCEWEGKLKHPLWKSIKWFLRELDIDPLQDPAIPLISIYPRDVPSYHKDICSTMFTTALFIIARNWKQPR